MKLSSEPTANVTVSLAGDNTEGSLSSSTPDVLGSELELGSSGYSHRTG